jgi:predicted Zn-dependent peptidase
MLSRSDAADQKAEDFDRTLEDSGIQLTHSLEPDGLSWQLVARSRDQDRALGLLADRLLRTVFESLILEAQRLACWQDEEQKEASPQRRLREALVQAPDSQPTLASLGAITLEDLLAFRARVFRPDRAVLVLHGDLGLEQAKRLVLLSLGSWTAQETIPSVNPPSSGAPVHSTLSPKELPRVTVPGLGLRVQAVAARPGDLPAEAVGLLSLLVPVDAALSPVSVAMDDDYLVATLDAEAGASGPSTWSLLHERLEGLRRRGFTQADLDRARSAWLASRSLDSLHPEAQLDATLAAARGLGVSVDRLNALSLDTLNAGLRNWLDPARIRSGAAGDPERLKTLPIL